MHDWLVEGELNVIQGGTLNNTWHLTQACKSAFCGEVAASHSLMSRYDISSDRHSHVGHKVQDGTPWSDAFLNSGNDALVSVAKLIRHQSLHGEVDHETKNANHQCHHAEPQAWWESLLGVLWTHSPWTRAWLAMKTCFEPDCPVSSWKVPVLNHLFFWGCTLQIPGRFPWYGLPHTNM